jgi:D-alanine-D-alanine ligase
MSAVDRSTGAAAKPPMPRADGPLKVAVLAGGRSSEHEVSLSSGTSVREGLLAGGHEVLLVEIGRDGAWRCEGEELALHPGAGLLGVDVAFPVLHGPFGEDGTVQGVLEMLDVPYVGAGVAASAVCMDKVLFKDLMAAGGVPQVSYRGVRRERYRTEPEAVLGELEELGAPVFVKPAHLGSSVGIVKVRAPEELADALGAAFAHDALVIVEAASSGTEVECGVLGTLRAEREQGAEEVFVSVPGEIVLTGEWYDYEAKYTPGGMELKVPARISPRAAEEVRTIARRAFADTGCDGLARVDFFVEGERVMLNELNTMPGFTPTSVYGRLLEASGVPYEQLVERLCVLGLDAHSERRTSRY